jgi:hypothetical protein
MTQVLIDIPNSSIKNQMIVGPIDASKVTRHESVNVQLFGPTTTVTALTQDIHIVRGATGTLLAIQAAICGTIATGADRTVTVDLQKSTGAGAYATVLSSTVGFTNVSVLRTAVSGVLSGTSVIVADILRLIVTVAGAAGAQALGLVVTVTMEETET